VSLYDFITLLSRKELLYNTLSNNDIFFLRRSYYLHEKKRSKKPNRASLLIRRRPKLVCALHLHGQRNIGEGPPIDIIGN
jgi:hypothetical protein